MFVWFDCLVSVFILCKEFVVVCVGLVVWLISFKISVIFRLFVVIYFVYFFVYWGVG